MIRIILLIMIFTATILMSIELKSEEEVNLQETEEIDFQTVHEALITATSENVSTIPQHVSDAISTQFVFRTISEENRNLLLKAFSLFQEKLTQQDSINLELYTQIQLILISNNMREGDPDQALEKAAILDELLTSSEDNLDYERQLVHAMFANIYRIKEDEEKASYHCEQLKDIKSNKDALHQVIFEKFPKYPSRQYFSENKSITYLTYSINECGAVEDITINPEDKSRGIFKRTAEKSLAKRLFIPAFQDGVAVRSSNIPIKFNFAQGNFEDPNGADSPQLMYLRNLPPPIKQPVWPVAKQPINY